MQKIWLLNERSQQYMAALREIVLPLPGTEEYLCYGTPAFRVKKKLLARLREDGETLAVHADDRDIWMEAQPGMFFVTPHYQNSAMVLVKLDGVDSGLLKQVLTEAWLQIAPKRVLTDWQINQEKA